MSELTTALKIKPLHHCSEPTDYDVGELDDDSKLNHLYRLATQFYLSAMSASPPAPATAQLSELKSDATAARRDAFALMSKVTTCERQFPLLILGAEATTDEERRIVLDLIARTERKTQIRALKCLREAVKSLWALGDLPADGDMRMSFRDRLAVVAASAGNLYSIA
jgi:hypothetical protein